MNGYFDIVIMGTGFGRKLESKFFQYANLVKLNLLKREPFTTRNNVLNFWFINSTANLNLKAPLGFESALTWDVKAMKRALGSTPMNILHILDWNNGYGGALGQVSATGLNKLIDPFAGNPNYCKSDISARAFDGISPHEIGHSCGCEHDFTQGNHVMYFATNGGCFLVGMPFTTEHQAIINSTIDKALTT